MRKSLSFKGIPQLTIGRKLGFAFGLALSMLLAVSAYAIIGLNRANAITRELTLQSTFGDAVDNFEINLYLARATLEDYIHGAEGGNPEQVVRSIDQVVDACDICHKDAGYSGTTPHTSPQVQDLVRAAADIRTAMRERADTSLALFAERDLAGVNDSLVSLDTYLSTEAKSSLDELNAVVDENSRALSATATSQTRTMTVVISVLGVFAVAMAIGAGVLITRSILTQVNAISSTYSEVGLGNFQARAEVTSDDELGSMAVSLNAMLDNTLSLIETREERDAMQASVKKLLTEVKDVAQGDLSVEAEVTADITGAIADSFNLMIGQLREIIAGVQAATLRVSSSANEIRNTTEHLSQGSEQQALQIADASAAIEEMATSIAQVSENASVSASVGAQALANAQQGARAVQDTVDGMNRIREQVQETGKRIKRLGESSQEIGEIVQLIGDIADRTSILALNASIQAAMAGDAGRGFAVVAEEVERLAQRATEATKKIDTLIRTIQNETKEATAAMEATTNEVVGGSVLAEEAGRALSEIEAVSNRLAELSQSISLAAKQQARGSENLAKSMGDIAEVTGNTAAGTKQASVSITSLAELADQLRESVSAFKMPGGNGRGSAT